ncbi:secretory phospholipase A2 receptor [Cricetulus griseus]|nr:secretory phospholipase A2 receptor [Cricetulus griseus]
MSHTANSPTDDSSYASVVSKNNRRRREASTVPCAKLFIGSEGHQLTLWNVRPNSPDWYQYDAPWVFYQDAEYLFYTYSGKWEDYEFVCGWLKSDILTIYSAQEQEFILSKIKVCFLVSIPKDTQELKTWTGAQDFCIDKGGTLVSIESELEQDAMNDFVVVFILDTPEHHVNTSDMYSVPNTLEFGNRTYKIIRANMTWYTAGRACLMHGAELASITDSFHQAFLTVILNRLGHAHWIGLSTTDNGLNFGWSDGTKSPFTYWKDEESALFGDCVFADTNGHWHSTACESFLQGAICHVATGSNLLAIKDEAENLFLLEEILAFSSSVQMVWLNAQFDSNNVPVVMEHPVKGRSYSIVPLAISLTLIIALVISILSFWLYKQNGDFFQRLRGPRSLYYPTLSFSTAHLEDNILISDLEKNNQ